MKKSLFCQRTSGLNIKVVLNEICFTPLHKHVALLADITPHNKAPFVKSPLLTDGTQCPRQMTRPFCYSCFFFSFIICFMPSCRSAWVWSASDDEERLVDLCTVWFLQSSVFNLDETEVTCGFAVIYYTLHTTHHPHHSAPNFSPHSSPRGKEMERCSPLSVYATAKESFLAFSFNNEPVTLN